MGEEVGALRLQGGPVMGVGQSSETVRAALDSPKAIARNQLFPSRYILIAPRSDNASRLLMAARDT